MLHLTVFPIELRKVWLALKVISFMMLMVSCEYSYWAGLSQSGKPGKRALPRASTCRGFPSILWAQTNPLQLTHGHISKHCFMDGLGCGNRSAGERECIQTREQKKVDAECSRGESEVCECAQETYIYMCKVYCKLHWHITQFGNNNKKGSDVYGCLLSMYKWLWF